MSQPLTLKYLSYYPRKNPQNAGWLTVNEMTHSIRSTTCRFVPELPPFSQSVVRSHCKAKGCVLCTPIGISTLKSEIKVVYKIETKLRVFIMS